MGLIFKKIAIKNGRHSGAPAAENSHIELFYFAPFESMVSGAEKEKKCRWDSKNLAAITLKPTAATWLEVYHQLKSVLEFIYKGQLNG